MHRLKKAIARNFESFTYFYRHLHQRVLIVLGMSVLVGLLDGLGLSMFLPLLQMVNDSAQTDAEGMGKMGFLVDIVNDLGLELDLITVLGIIVLVFFLKGIAKFGNEAYRTLVQQFFIKTLRIGLLRTLNLISFKFYVTSDVGRIQNTMTGEIDRISLAFLTYFKSAEQAVLVLVYMGFAFFVDFQFALLVTIGGALTNFVYRTLYKLTKTASKKFTEDSHGYQGQVIQHVANFKYLKASGQLNKYVKKLNSNIHQIEVSRRKMGMINAIMMGAREPLLILVVAAVILIQTLWLKSPLGPILISLLFFYRALTALMQMQQSWNRFLTVSGSLENVQEFQKELRMNREEKGKSIFPGFKERLVLKNISFSYGESKVLCDIDLSIRKNETIAFVGESGSGKTTLVNLLAGLIPVDKGQMLLDSYSLKALDPSTYQERIGYITQEPVIFNDTIFNNVTFWADKNDPENSKRFNEVLKKAAVHEFVSQLPQKEETVLGSNGVNLSGGQKQRISIARELYKDIDILIMDEATSALDTETEKEIQNSIDALKGKYTILIVAHRLSTVKNVDRIVLMKNGRIESVGSYKELFNENKRFKRMVELQEL